MARLLTGSIDASKIDKSKIQSTNAKGEPFKNGAKYVNISIWVNDEVDQYGNIASVQQFMGKDAPKNYIGNLKDFENPNTEEKAETAEPIGEDELTILMARDKRIDYFSKNLKTAIKSKGHKVVDFPVEFLGCTYQTFNWRLQNGHFLAKDLYICMDLLDVTLDNLLEKVEIKKKKKYSVTNISSGNFKMLKDFLQD